MKPTNDCPDCMTNEDSVGEGGRCARHEIEFLQTRLDEMTRKCCYAETEHGKRVLEREDQQQRAEKAEARLSQAEAKLAEKDRLSEAREKVVEAAKAYTTKREYQNVGACKIDQDRLCDALEKAVDELAAEKAEQAKDREGE